MKISVIMPVYNRENLVRESIDSILDQTFSDFELIVIDDCSSDRTAEVVRQISDKRIKLIRNTFKCTLPILRNEGVSLAQGEYIAYMEAHPECGALSCHYQVFGDRDFVVKLPLTHEDICGSLLVRCTMNNGGCMLRKSLFDEGMHHRNEYYICDYYMFWIDLIGRTKMANLDEILVKVRFGEHQMTRQSLVIRQEQALRNTFISEARRVAFDRMGLELTDEQIDRYNAYLQQFKDAGMYTKEEKEEIRIIYQRICTSIAEVHPEFEAGFANYFGKRFPFISFGDS